MLFVGRIIDGASGGSLSVAQAAVTDIAPPEQRPRLLGMLGAAFGIGFVLGPAIGGLAALGGPHVPFYVAGVLATINAIAALIRLPETAHRRRANPSAGARAAQPGAAPAGADRLPDDVLLRRVRGDVLAARQAPLRASPRPSVSVVFLMIGIVLVVMQGGVYHRLVRRHDVARVYLGGVLSIAGGLALIAAATSWPMLIVALVLLGIGQGVANPAITTSVAQHAPAERRGEALGFQQSAYSVARVVGPPVAGALFDRAVWSPYVLAAVLCAIGGALLVAGASAAAARRRADG